MRVDRRTSTTKPYYRSPTSIITIPTSSCAALARRLVASATAHRSALAAMVAALVGFAAIVASVAGWTSVGLAAGAMVSGHAAAAAVAGLTARAAARRASGVSRRVWILFSAGLAVWTAGCLSYVAFLVAGGSPSTPAAWTQIGFLLAYVPWYRGLWLLRQPVLAPNRRRRWESVLIECIALALIALVLGAALWYEALTPGQNLVLLVPGVLDLLLLAGLYNAVRRSSLTRSTAHGWLALGFLALSATDIAVTVLIPRGHYTIAGLFLTGYAIAMGLVGTAATRPLRLAETQDGVGRSSAFVALVALGLVAPATALLPSEGRLVVWCIGGALIAWLLSRVTLEGRDDVDPLTGMLQRDALQRHLSGVLSLARDDRPAGLLVVEMHGLGEYTAVHGFREADGLMRKVGQALEAVDLPEGGVWSRSAPQRLVWLGVVLDAENGRRLGHRVSSAALSAAGILEPRCGLALVPGDADSPEDALAAAQEAAAAAKTGNRRVVLFDRGRLDGLQADAGYGTSLRARRARILQIIASAAQLEAVFQPIVELDHMEVRGYEALSRFLCDPRQGPDLWIAEAHALGLGVELEAECIRRALARRHEAPPGRYLSVNASPELLLSPALDEAVASHSLDGIVFEITEHHHVSDYALLANRLSLLRGRGARVAIDDVGAGHSSMRHVMNLRPDLIKVDRWMVSGVSTDSGKRALLRSFLALSSELGADLVVEGVETLEELCTLRELGAMMAQGYLFARPDREFLEVVAGAHEMPPASVTGASS